jgi:hypothetical protein
MDVLRVVDAFCASCDDVRPHAIMTDDPSSCFCNACGTCQTLVTPINAPAQPAMDRLVARRRCDRPGPGEIWFSDRPTKTTTRRSPHENGPRREDIWSVDRVLAGMDLLTEAMAHQRDIDALHDLSHVLAKSIEAIRRRGLHASEPPQTVPA